ncbi:hypothetical protein JOM56_012229, partial [Amanita muscaria]
MSPTKNIHPNSNEEQLDSQPPPSTHQGHSTPLRETHPSSNESVDHLAVANCKGSDERLPSTATSSEALDRQEHHTLYQDRMNPRIPTPNATTMFQGAHGFYISGQPRFVNNFTVNEQSNNPGGSQGFVNFAQFVSFEALHDSSAQDFDRHVDQVIREKTLNQLQEWFDDPTVPAEQIIWLHGPASIGKTAIALEIARQEKVVATFFFNRSDPSRNDGNRLFPTLAWQLAVSIADVKTHITHVLNERPDLPKKRIEEQFEYLVAQPFAAMKKATFTQRPSCLVIVIDGIDECADIGLQRRILKVIEKSILGRRVPLQFIVFSRPDNQLQCATRCIDLAKLGPAAEIKKREREVRKREEELKEEEYKLKMRVEEISKKEDEARKREEGARLKEDEANVRELEVRRKEREMLQRAKEMEARRKELAVKYLEEEAGSSEEKTHRREEEIKMKQEELDRKEDEIMHLAEEMRQKAEEIKRQEEELMKRKEELERRELESRLEEGEAKRRQGEAQ